MEVRELRYFVAVAEELHFGRAAARLSMAQPPLSRAIQQLERRLGDTLLERRPRTIALTRAGAVLLREARVTLETVEAAERRTRRAGDDRPTIAFAAKAGAATDLVSALLDALAARPAFPAVELLLGGPGEAEGFLRTGQADVALLLTPYDSTAGLHTQALRSERQSLVLPIGHRLADRAEVLAAEIEQVALPRPRWPRSDGRYPDGPGPRVRDQAQLLQLIRLGRTYSLMPESALGGLRDGLAVVAVPDAPPVTTTLAWPEHALTDEVADLIRVATALS